MSDLTIASFRPEPASPWSRDTVRIVSWNIERGLRFPGILEFLRSIEADLILLQEVDLNARRTRCRNVASELAQALRLNVAFAKAFQELGQGSRARPAFQGQATLSPWPLSNARIIHFRYQSNFWKPRWYVPQFGVFQRRTGGRIALVTEANIYGRKLVTYNLHLESKGDDTLRLRQLSEVLEDGRRCSGPSISVIGGDFNMNAGNGDVAQALRHAGLHDGLRAFGQPTTRVRGTPHHAGAIDWIFVSSGLEPQGRVHDDIHESDHWPISATITTSRP